MKQIDFYTKRMRRAIPSLSSRLLLVLCFMMGLVISNSAYGQTDCKTGCTSNDVQIKRAFLVKNAQGDPLDQCESGATVTAYLWLELTTNTPRVGVSISARLVETVNGVPGSQSLGECFGIPLASEGTTIVKYTQPVTWTCGSEVQLKDVFIAWGTGNKNFCTSSAAQCPATPSKCWQQGPADIIIVETFPCSSARIDSHPSQQTKCDGESASFAVSYSGGNPTPVVTWQINTGSGFANLTIASPYSVTTANGTTTLAISSVSTSMSGYQYRAVLTSATRDNTCTATSNSATLTVNNNPAAPVLSVVNNCGGTSTVTAKDAQGNTISGTELTWTGTSQTGNPITVSTTSSITATRTVSGCTSSSSNSVTPAPKTTPGAPVLSVQNNCNGTSTVTAKDGSGNNIASSELAWSNSATGNPITVSATTSITATRTVNDCTSPASNSVTPAPKSTPDAPALSILINPNCTGALTVVNSVTGVAYGAGYEFSKDGGTWTSNPNFTYTPGESFNIRVRRTGDDACIASIVCPAEPAAITSQSSSSLQSIEQPIQTDDQLTAYPIPFSERTTLEFKAERDGNYEINLYDMKGTLIRQLKSGTAKAGEVTQIEVDGRSMADGMYLARMVSGTGAKTVKLLKKNN